MIGTIDVRRYRKPNYDIDPLFIERWSPRAFSGEPITDEQLMRLIEAARWSPSAYNNQPWRFLYAHRDSEHWNTFVDLLVEGNREWAHRASALVLLVSKTTNDRNGIHMRTHSFDAGSAWFAFALQSVRDGLIAHPMQGFDENAARETLNVPEEFHVEIMIAVGSPGDPDVLSKEYQAREKPNGRRPIEDIAWEGPFRK